MLYYVHKTFKAWRYSREQPGSWEGERGATCLERSVTFSAARGTARGKDGSVYTYQDKRRVRVQSRGRESRHNRHSLLLYEYIGYWYVLRQLDKNPTPLHLRRQARLGSSGLSEEASSSSSSSSTTLLAARNDTNNAASAPTLITYVMSRCGVDI